MHQGFIEVELKWVDMMNIYNEKETINVLEELNVLFRRYSYIFTQINMVLVHFWLL